MVRKGGWAYKEERRLLALAGSGKTLEQIAKAMDRTPDSIRNRSIRLGVSIKPKAATRKIRVEAH
jgi:DNA-binding CsgD family transcriptional regulator